MKHLVLHIGVKKTGTTTLQKFLEVNRNGLRDRGYVYLRTPGARWSSLLADLARGHRDATSVPGDFVERLKVEVNEEADRGVSCAIGSFEGLVDLGREDIQFLFETLGALFEDISVHLYLRRQDLAVVSHYSTALRGGGVRRTMLPAVPDLKNKAFNYELLLDLWSGVIGDARIKPRIFQTEDLRKGDLIEDFLHVLGIDGDGLVRPPNVNVALPDDVKLFLQSFNEHVPARVGDKPNPLRGPIFHLLDHLDGPRKMKPSRREALEFYEPFREPNAKVAERWFPGRPSLFSEDFSEYPETAVRGELTADDAVRIAAHLWKSLVKHRPERDGGSVRAASGANALRASSRRGAQAPAAETIRKSKLVAPQFCCNLCGYEGPFLSFGGKNGLRHNAKCPKCGSLERTRFQCLAIDMLFPEAAGRTILELSPTRALYDYVVGRGFVYSGVALKPDAAKFQGMNVTARNLCDEADSPDKHDVILNSHVLDHLRCDYASVLKRLSGQLTVDGFHVIGVRFGGRRTVEGTPLDAGNQEREAESSRAGRVRTFGDVDFPEHLRSLFGDRFAEIPKSAFLRDGRDVFAIGHDPERQDFNRLFVIGARPVDLALE